ncbi:hypothetical protein C5167_047342 [Papaver somniferum]|uniref:Kinesin motor domain-containing protein n=1 Tax=Papaver somniferum TaxID=3469 RepID=A0A4Y7LJA6_PAPSO|nr:hypothetical protein C5167_047342 [Papaver somniferum]
MSYMEIYNEEINGLLAPEHCKLQIRKNIDVVVSFTMINPENMSGAQGRKCKATSVTHSEAIGILSAIKWEVHHSLPRILLVSDNLSVVKAINGSSGNLD